MQTQVPEIAVCFCITHNCAPRACGCTPAKFINKSPVVARVSNAKSQIAPPKPGLTVRFGRSTSTANLVSLSHSLMHRALHWSVCCLFLFCFLHVESYALFFLLFFSFFLFALSFLIFRLSFFVFLSFLHFVICPIHTNIKLANNFSLTQL